MLSSTRAVFSLCLRNARLLTSVAKKENNADFDLLKTKFAVSFCKRHEIPFNEEDLTPVKAEEIVTTTITSNVELSQKAIKYAYNYCLGLLQRDKSNFLTMDLLSEILSPRFLEERVMCTCLKIGVSKPDNLLYRCPDILISAAKIVDKSTGTTMLDTAVNFLREKFSKKDLLSLIKNNPMVLTYNVSELEERYNFLMLDLRLEPDEHVILAKKHPHAWRHSTQMRLATTPGWYLPLDRVKFCHTLLRSLNQWPPIDLVSNDGSIISKEKQWNKLQKASLSQIASTLNLKSNTGRSQLNSSDIIMFKKMCDLADENR